MNDLIRALTLLGEAGASSELLAVSYGLPSIVAATDYVGSVVLTLRAALETHLSKRQWSAATDVLCLSRVLILALQRLQQCRLESPVLPRGQTVIPPGVLRRAAHGVVSALNQPSSVGLHLTLPGMHLLRVSPSISSARAQLHTARVARQPVIAAAAMPSLQQSLLALDTTAALSCSHALSGVFSAGFGGAFARTSTPHPARAVQAVKSPAAPAIRGNAGTLSGLTEAAAWHGGGQGGGLTLAAAVAAQRDAAAAISEEMVVTVSLPLQLASAGDEPCELWMALYDAATGRPVSQEWLLSLDRSGCVCLPEHSQMVAPGVFVASDVKQASRQLGIFGGSNVGDGKNGGAGGLQGVTLSFSGVLCSFLRAGRAYLGCRAYRLGRLRPRSGLVRNLLSSVHDTARRAAGVTSPSSVASPSSTGGRARSGSDDVSAAGPSRWKKLFSRGGVGPGSPESQSRRGSDASVTAALLGSASGGSSPVGSPPGAVIAGSNSWNDVVPLSPGASVLDTAYRRPLAAAVCFIPASAVPNAGRAWRSRRQEAALQGAAVPGGAVAGPESDSDSEGDSDEEGGVQGGVHSARLQWWFPQKGDESAFFTIIPQLIAADVATAHSGAQAVIGSLEKPASELPPRSTQPPKTSDEGGPSRIGRLYAGRARAASDRSTSSPFSGVSVGGHGGASTGPPPPHGLAQHLREPSAANDRTWGGAFATHRYAFRSRDTNGPPPRSLPWCDVRPGSFLQVTRSAAQATPLEKAPRMEACECTLVLHSLSASLRRLVRAPATAAASAQPGADLVGGGPSPGLPAMSDTEDNQHPPQAALVGGLLPWLKSESAPESGPMSGALRTSLHWQLLAAGPLHSQRAAVALGQNSHISRASGHWPSGRQSGKRQAKRSSLYRALEEVSKGGGSMDGDQGGESTDELGSLNKGSLVPGTPVYGGGDLHGVGGGVIPADAHEMAPYEDVTGVTGWIVATASALMQDSLAQEYSLNVLAAVEMLQGGLKQSRGTDAGAPGSQGESLKAELRHLTAALKQGRGVQRAEEGGPSHLVDLAARCIEHIKGGDGGGAASLAAHWELMSLHPATQPSARQVLAWLKSAADLHSLLSLSEGVLSASTARTYGGTQSRALAQRGVVAELPQVMQLLSVISISASSLSAFQAQSTPLPNLGGGAVTRGRGVSVVGRRHSVVQGDLTAEDIAAQRVAAAAATAMLGQETDSEGDEGGSVPCPVDPLWTGQQVSYVQVTLNSGQFQQGKKKAGMNMQVRLHAVRRDGSVLPCLVRGVGWGGMAVPGDLGQAVARDFVGPLTDEDGIPVPLTCAYTDGSGVVQLAVQAEPDASPVRRQSMSAANGSTGTRQGAADSSGDTGLGMRSHGFAGSSLSGPRHRVAATPKAEVDPPHHHVFAEHRTLFPEYRSAVYYHCNTPVWDETVTVVVPTSELFDDLHIRLAYYHVSANDGRSFPVGFSFFPLAHPGTRVAVRSGRHDLPVYDAVQFMSTSQRQVAKSAAPYRRASALKVTAGSPLQGLVSKTPYLNSFLSTPLARCMFERGPAAQRMTVFSPPPSRNSVRDRSLLLAKPGEAVSVTVVVQSSVRTANAPLHTLLCWRVSLSTPSDRQRLNSALLALMDSSPEHVVAHFAQVMSHLCALMLHLHSGNDAEHPDELQEAQGTEQQGGAALHSTVEEEEKSATDLHHSGLVRSCLGLFSFMLLQLQDAACPPPVVSHTHLPGKAAGVEADLHTAEAHRPPMPSLAALLAALRDGITPQEVLQGGVRGAHEGGSGHSAPPHTRGAQSANTPALRVAASCTLEHFLRYFFSSPGLHVVIVDWVVASLAAAPSADCEDPVVRSTSVMLLGALPSIVRLLVHSALLTPPSPPSEHSSPLAGPAVLQTALKALRRAVLVAVSCPVVTSVATVSLPVQRLAWHAVVQSAALQGAAASLGHMQVVTPDSTLRDWMGSLLTTVQPLAQLPVLASMAGCLEPPVDTVGGAASGLEGGLPASASVRWQSVPQAFKLRGWVPGSKALAVAKLCTLQALLSHATLAPRCDVPESVDPSHSQLWHVACITAHQHLAATAQSERMLAAAIATRLCSSLHSACTAHQPAGSDLTPPLLPREGPLAAPLSSAAWRVFTLLPELASAVSLCVADSKEEEEAEGGGGSGEGGFDQDEAPHKPPPYSRVLHPFGPALAINLDACPSGPMQAAGLAGDITSRAVLIPANSSEGRTQDAPVSAAKRRGLFSGDSPKQHRDSAVSTRNSVPLEQSLVMLQMVLAPVAMLELKVGSLQNAVGASSELAVEPLLAVDAHVWLLPQLLEQPFVTSRWAAAQQWGHFVSSVAAEDTLSGLQSFGARSTEGVGGTRGVSFNEDASVMLGAGSGSESGTATANRRSWSTFTARTAGGIANGGSRARQGTTLQPPAEDDVEVAGDSTDVHGHSAEAPKAGPPSDAIAFGAEQTLCSTYRFLVDSLVTLAEVAPEAAFARLCQSLSTPDGGFLGTGASSSTPRTVGGPVRSGSGTVRRNSGAGQLAGASLDPFVRAVLSEGGRLALLCRVITAVNCILESPAYPAQWVEHHTRCAAAAVRYTRWASFAAASLYLHETVEMPSPPRALVRDIAGGMLLKPLISAHVSLLTSHFSFVHAEWGGVQGPLPALLTQLGLPSVPAAVMETFSVLWGPRAVPQQRAYVAAAATGPGNTGAMQLSKSSAGGSYLPARLRLLCAPLVIPVALEMTHAKHTQVAQWARDLFLDVLKAEVQTVSTTTGNSPTKSPKRAHRRSFAVLAKAPQEEIQTSLPASERWTIDTIDAIVARGGVILLPKWATHADDSPAEPDDASGTRGRNVYQPSGDNMLMRLFSSGSSGQTLSSTASIAPQHKGLLALPQVQKFLVECRTLFRMLSAVNSYPADPPELFEEERTEAALTLIQYLRNTHRADLFTTYVRYLTELHAKMGNHAEAAYTQLLLLDLLSAQPVSQDAGTAADASTIDILHGVLTELTQGSQDWEQALLISRILAGRYFRLGSREAYLALQQVLNTTAKIVYDLAKESTGRSKARARPPHYAVQYIGQGFPGHLRGRTFVYRQHTNKAVAVFERGLRQKWSRIVAETERGMEAAGTLPTDCPRSPALLIKVPFDPLLQAVHVDGMPASSIDPDAGGSVTTTTQESVDLDALPPHRDLRIAVMTVEPAPLAQQEAVEAAAVYLQSEMQDDTLQLQMYADALACDEELPMSPAGGHFAAESGDTAAHQWNPSRHRCELRHLALLDSPGDIPDAVQAYADFSAAARTVQMQSSLEASILVPATVPRVDWRNMPLPPQVPTGAAPIVTPRVILVPPPPAESHAHPRALVSLARACALKAGAFTLQALTSEALVRDMDVDAAVAAIMCQDSPSATPSTGDVLESWGIGSRHSSAGSNPSAVSSHRVSLGSRADAARLGTRRGSTTKRNPRRPSLLQVPEAGESAHRGENGGVFPAVESPSVGAALESETAADLKDAMREQGSEGILPVKYSLIPPQLVPSVAPPSMDFVPVPPPNYGVSPLPEPVSGSGASQQLQHVWDDNWSAVFAAVRHDSIKQQSRYDNMPRPLRQGREQSRVRVFAAQRPVKTRKTSNESLDVWVRCVWLVTNSAFPNLHRRSQVTHMHQILLTPFDSAIMLLRNKSDDVRFCLSRAMNAPPKSDVNFLTGQLKGVLDAAVQGGIANYEVLLTGKYVHTHPEIRQELELRYGAVMAQWQAAEEQTANANTNGDSASVASSDDTSDDETGTAASGAADFAVEDGAADGRYGADAPALAALRHALADQMAVCGDGLVLHAKKCKADMLPLHDYLCEKHSGLCDRLEALGVPVQQARDLGINARELSQQMQVLGAQAAATTA